MIAPFLLLNLKRHAPQTDGRTDTHDKATDPMALKKSELYSSLWSGCDELRGGMDASQYKDYVLVLLFVKYISDKYAGVPYAPITVPKGASFKDMAALKGKPDIGDQINKRIIAPLANANKLSDMPDFDDATKLGTGKEKVDRLTNLICIFENPSLDFSKNRAEGDDILGDAYEYLMRHFATESGKSKGQFYTPAEVSRVMARIIGIREARTTTTTTVYDPTCGSGSLLLKVGDEARAKVTLYGQEKDAATAGLARMNMILHDNPTALIWQGNTLTAPRFTDASGQLKTFDYVVANPPFSDKRWSTGLNPADDPFGRFEHFGIPPAKQGDYAYLLHIVRSLKSTGKGACILPHGVLFRGNAEAEIRRNLIGKGYIKGIIGLPANLFYGTGIPACIVIIDKEDAHTRKGIFLVDASKGFAKDGPKNRLREQDIHRIVDVFANQREVPRYARMVSVAEIEKNDFNLNIPRYIDSQEPEDLQDIEAHLKGGIPVADVDALAAYWDVCPKLRRALFADLRRGYLRLAADKAAIKPAIYGHPEFAHFIAGMETLFNDWRTRAAATLKALKPGCHPKTVIETLGEELLAHYTDKPLIARYDVYQHLMDYWAATLQDDCYLIAADGWKATPCRVIETKKGKDGKSDRQVDKGWACDLVPKPLLVARYFAAEQAAIDKLAADLETLAGQLTELEEEHGGEDGAFAELEKINRAEVLARLRELQAEAAPAAAPLLKVAETPARYGKAARRPLPAALPVWTAPSETSDPADERSALTRWLALADRQADLKKRLHATEEALDAKALAKYPELTEAEIKTLVVEDKWLTALATAIHGEMDRISQTLTRRVKELAERYETPLPQAVSKVAKLEAKVNRHLKQMGFAL